MKSIDNIIEHFDLLPHPEGGYYQLIYEDVEKISGKYLHGEFKGSRHLFGAVYYLLPRPHKCVLHKLKMTEMWNFYLGGPLELFDISPAGELKKTILGQNIFEHQELTYIFPKDHWIGARLLPTTQYSLVSCVTSPGFTYDDWVLGKKRELVHEYPDFEDIISLLTNS